MHSGCSTRTNRPAMQCSAVEPQVFPLSGGTGEGDALFEFPTLHHIGQNRSAVRPGGFMTFPPG